MDNIYTDGRYLAANPTWHTEDSEWKAKQVFKMLSAHGIVPQTIAEVGCGAGQILRHLQLRIPAARCFGFDVSAEAIAMARTIEASDLQFFQEDIRGVSDEFDVLLVMDVIEHVEDCFGFCRALRSKAKYKVFHIPLDAYPWNILRGGLMRVRREVGHIHYFTKDTALALLRDAGYEIVDWFYTPAYEEVRIPNGTKLFSVFHQQTLKLARSVLSRTAPSLNERTIGGCSLLVLAK